MAQLPEVLEVVRLMEAFRAFDADNDGLITASQLSELMASLGHAVAGQDVKAMMQKAEKNQDGLLGFREFLKMTAMTEKAAKILGLETLKRLSSSL
ncbi:hypothetical protein Syun_003081 [Stephania yunnanensis]|uniref:EF-hand domain-containing protein n=1 Tax=Stephania yunnanensis TaxID=152371 RepID=A0AAP0L4D6_9MAGN